MSLLEQYQKAVEIITSIAKSDDASEQDVYDTLSQLNELIAHERKQLKTQREKRAQAATTDKNEF